MAGTDEATLVQLDDGTILDPATGEIVEEGAGLRSAENVEGGRAGWLAAQHDLAARQAKAWAERKVGIAMVLDTVATEKKFETPSLRVTMVSGSHVDTATAEDIMRAERLELISINEATDLIVAAAKGNVDVGVVKSWIEKQPEERRGVLTEALISGYDRRGYPLIKPVLQDALKGATRG